MILQSCRVRSIGWLLAGLLLALGPAQGLEVELTSEGAVVSGVTPGGEVALLSVWREDNAQGSTEVTLLDEVMGDHDADGKVSFEASDLGRRRPVPELSVWVAVDITTGDAAFETLGDFTPKMAEGRYQGLTGSVELEVARPVVLWVRPGLGAFHAQARDGKGRDRDPGTDGRVVLGPGDFERSAGRSDPTGGPGDPPKPTVFEPSDVVVGVDVWTLALVAQRIQ